MPKQVAFWKDCGTIGEMSFWTTIAAIAGTLLVGAVSPGPSFVMVAQTAVSTSRRSGLAVAAGIAVGGIAFAVLALVGLQRTFQSVPLAYAVLKIGGGLYLLSLAVRIWRSSGPTLERQIQPVATSKAFRRGLVTHLANPKTAIVYASAFAAFAPQSGIDARLSIAILCAVFLIEVGWYSVVALLLSTQRPRNAYLRSKSKLDKASSAVLGVLGGKLIVGARTTGAV